MISVALEERNAQKEIEDARFAMLAYTVSLGANLQWADGTSLRFEDFIPGTQRQRPKRKEMTGEDMWNFVQAWNKRVNT